jgi:L-ribulose-5-phosphate 3-epimerase
MSKLRLGISLPSLGLPTRRGLQEAARLGVTGVQLEATGDLSPTVLSQTGRRELRNLLRAHNLELTALGCPLRRGLDVAENQQPRIEHVKAVLSLSFDLGPRVVLIKAGRTPDEADSARSRLMTEALLALGHHGDRTGAVLALESGLESGEGLVKFLSRFDTGGLGINVDPASFLLNGFDPYENTRALHGRLTHANARDARAAAAQEVPLGHGDIEWMRYLSILEEIEYRGWLVIKRETGENRLADVANGVAFLRRLVG